jgi:hypothetical protein
MLLSVALRSRRRKIRASDENLFCRIGDRACPKTRRRLAAGEVLRGLISASERSGAYSRAMSPLGHKQTSMGHKQISISLTNDVRQVPGADIA